MLVSDAERRRVADDLSSSTRRVGADASRIGGARPTDQFSADADSSSSSPAAAPFGAPPDRAPPRQTLALAGTAVRAHQRDRHPHLGLRRRERRLLAEMGLPRDADHVHAPGVRTSTSVPIAAAAPVAAELRLSVVRRDAPLVRRTRMVERVTPRAHESIVLLPSGPGEETSMGADWRDSQTRYVVHFDDGGSGMRYRSEPLAVGVERIARGPCGGGALTRLERARLRLRGGPQRKRRGVARRRRTLGPVARLSRLLPSRRRDAAAGRR